MDHKEVELIAVLDRLVEDEFLLAVLATTVGKSSTSDAIVLSFSDSSSSSKFLTIS